MLRICNYMLKKLSRFRQSVLRSRVQLLISNIMPQVTERSGVNLKGAYNCWHDPLNTATENETYNKICHLKQFIDEPLEKLGSMDITKSFELIDFFLDKVNNNLTEIKKDYWEIAQDDQMLGYQLKDKRFVCEMILQCLILCHSFQKPANQNQKTSFTLSEGDLLKMKSCQNKLTLLLEKLNKSLHQGLEKVLHQENKWAEWKEQQCPSFEKAPAMEDPLPIESKNFSIRHLNGKGNHSSLFDENKYDPDLEKYLTKVYIDLDPEEDIEDEYKSKHDQVFSWRMLRLVSQTNLKTFQKIYDGDIEKIALELKPKTSEEMLTDEPVTDTMEVEMREAIEEPQNGYEDRDKDIDMEMEIDFTSDKSQIEEELIHTEEETELKEGVLDVEMNEEGEIANSEETKTLDQEGISIEEDLIETHEEIQQEDISEEQVSIEEKQDNTAEKQEESQEKAEEVTEPTVCKEETESPKEEVKAQEVKSEPVKATESKKEASKPDKPKQSETRRDERRSKERKEYPEKREDQRKKQSKPTDTKESYYHRDEERPRDLPRRDSQRNQDSRESPQRKDRDEIKSKDYKDSHKREEMKSRDQREPRDSHNTQPRREDLRSKEFRREEYKKDDKRSNYSRNDEPKRDFRDNREFFHRRDERGYKDQYRKDDRRDRDFPKKRGPLNIEEAPEKRVRRRSH